MNPFEYLNIMKDDLIHNCIKDNGFNPEQANEFYGNICSIIEKLTQARLKKEITVSIIDKLIIENDGDLLLFWLIDALWNDRSYQWANFKLAHYFNRKEQKLVYDTTKEILSNIELVELVKKEEKTFRYIIKNDDKMRQIFEIFENCFDCNYMDFREAIETANFNLLIINKKENIMYLTYLLSDIMDEVWYGEVCKKMGWKKTQCSGKGNKLKNSQIFRRLDMIIPK